MMKIKYKSKVQKSNGMRSFWTLTLTVLSLTLGLAACQRSEIQDIETPIFNISVSATDFASDDQAMSRANETAFEANDGIGLYVSQGTAAVNASGNHSSNILYRYTASKWNTTRTLSGALDASKTYSATAYYPYIHNLLDPTNITHQVAADQSTKGSLESSDFMVSALAPITGLQTTPQKPTSALAFTHSLSKLIVTFRVPSSLDGANVATLKEIKFNGLRLNCVVNLANGSVSAPTTVVSGAVTPRLTSTAGMAKGAMVSYEAVLPPQAIAAGASLVWLKFATDKGDRELTYALASDGGFTLTQNQKYTLTLNNIADLAFTTEVDNNSLLDGLLHIGMPLKIMSKTAWKLTSSQSSLLGVANTAAGGFSGSTSGNGSDAEQTVYLKIIANTTAITRSFILTLESTTDKTMRTTYTIVQNYFNCSIAQADWAAAQLSSQALAAITGNQVVRITAPDNWVSIASSSVAGQGDPKASTDVLGNLAANSLYFQTKANNTNAARSTTVSFTPVDLNGTLLTAQAKTCTISQTAPVINISSTTQDVLPHATSATFNVTASNQNGVTYTPVAGANATSVAPNTVQTVNITGNYLKAVTVGFAANTGAARNIVSTVKYGTSLTHTHTITQAAPALTISASSASVAAQATSATAFTVTSNVPFTPAYSSGASSGLGTGVKQPVTNQSVTMTFPAQGSAPAVARYYTMTFTPNPNYTASSQTRTFTVTQAAVLPTLTISSSAPGVLIPKDGATYTTDITSNTTWSATATNATVTATGTGKVTSFSIKANASPAGTIAREVKVVFTTTNNAGQTAATSTWTGTQETTGSVPDGCWPAPIPGFFNTYVATADNTTTKWKDAANNCAVWGGRLPTKDELVAIYNNKASYGTFSINPYWSSTSVVPSYYVVSLGSGIVGIGNSKTDYFVRCVKNA